jgi:hypothetical protein
MTMGMGVDGPNMHHVAVLAECHQSVLAAHLMADHEIPDESLISEIQSAGSLIMLHISLHGHVIQVPDGTDEL